MCPAPKRNTIQNCAATCAVLSILIFGLSSLAERYKARQKEEAELKYLKTNCEAVNIHLKEAHPTYSVVQTVYRCPNGHDYIM